MSAGNPPLVTVDDQSKSLPNTKKLPKHSSKSDPKAASKPGGASVKTKSSVTAKSIKKGVAPSKNTEHKKEVVPVTGLSEPTSNQSDKSGKPVNSKDKSLVKKAGKKGGGKKSPGNEGVKKKNKTQSKSEDQPSSFFGNLFKSKDKKKKPAPGSAKSDSPASEPPPDPNPDTQTNDAEQPGKSVETISSRKSSIFSYNKKKKGSIISTDPYQNAPLQAPLASAELKNLVVSRIYEIQRFRDDVKTLQASFEEAKQKKEAKLKNLGMLDTRHNDLRKQLAKEFVVRNEAAAKLEAAESKIADAVKKKSDLDLRDRYTCQIQSRVHGDISASLEGYSEYYTSLMFNKMKTLEIWHQLSQNYLEKTASMDESHQKARQAYTAATAKYKRVKTSRDQLSAELRRAHEENQRELQNFRNFEAETREKDELILGKYRDQMQRCLVNRDLKYELLLEAKDNLIARIKIEMEALHKSFSGLETTGSEVVQTFDELMRYCQIKSFSNNTTKLIDALPTEADYNEHLEKIQKTLAEYVACVHEIDNKRTALLKERAELVRLSDVKSDEKDKCKCPCPTEIKGVI